MGEIENLSILQLHEFTRLIDKREKKTYLNLAVVIRGSLASKEEYMKLVNDLSDGEVAKVTSNIAWEEVGLGKK